MHAIVVATQKGGSGKSTLAIGLAIAAMDDGHRVGVIDADPQGTISNWSRRRTNPKPRIARAGNGMAIERAILDLRREGFTLAVVDSPATDNVLSASAIAAADLCLIPARPSPADIEAALPTLGTVRRLDKRFAFVLNQTPARAAIAPARPRPRLMQQACSRFLTSCNAPTIRMRSELAWASPSSIPTGRPHKKSAISGGGCGDC